MSTVARPDPIASKLFGKLTRELLTLLYRDPERSLYLRELVRLTGASPGAVQREAGELTEAGLLMRSRRGRQVFYQANRGTPVFDELRGLLEKTMGGVDVLRAALAPRWLTGSRLRFCSDRSPPGPAVQAATSTCWSLALRSLPR